jgi:protein-disulfide isomerase
MSKYRAARARRLGIYFLLGGVVLLGSLGRWGASTEGTAIGDKILQYVREKFGVPENVKMTISSFQPFAYPAYDQAMITVDDGKQPKTQPVYVTKDRHYLIIGQLFPLGSDPKAEILQHIRAAFKVPESASLTVGPLRKSPFPNLSAFTLRAVNGGKEQAQDYYVTKDNHCLVLGSVFNLVVDPRQEALRTISTANQPSQGPAHAPVTIVEYADLQCPQCARLHEFLEKELVPKYGDKVRVVFKEFPLPMHDWSMTAAIANECVYRISPEAFVRFRSLIFQNQAAINITNVRDMLLGFADQAGVDRVQLAGCLDAKSSLPRIVQDQQEGKRLDVQSTPTCFVNGKIVVGMPPADFFYRAVDNALRGGG